MKVKDIITLVISLIIIIGAIYFFYTMFSPGSSNEEIEISAVEEVKMEYTGNIDKYKDILESVESFTDYGKPELDGIGRTNPFAPIE